ncbi:MAG TPA: NFACT RNA binding domain-containing protein, partial [Thermoplasmata archaeon]|nr:NFACT RNA binding domain-containing protein [Thermoplasmata archaeon]
AVAGGVVANLGGEAVTLLVGRPVRESANQLYGEVKRLQGKLAGARSALAGTVSALQAAPVATASGRPSQAGRIAGAPDARRRKAHWFEKYRWFYSSDGVLVIGGRDAATNDLIVRRYLKAADLYVHADIHGAPSVIIKHPTLPSGAISDATISEAAQWGVAFSKAWRAGLASGSAFWVRPDQVSKSGGTGEFVARGAWVIHGTKNYLRDLPTELAIGPTDVEGQRLWTVAPPSALRARGEVRFLLTPGEEREREAVEVSLTRETGLSRDRIQSLLPPGGVTARRV